MSTLDIARDYLARNWKPIPVPYRAKGPKGRDWQNLHITTENIHKYFNGEPQNVGVQLGAKSSGLTDVDLDCAEAVELASHFLPTTSAVFGRTSKPRSHFLYYIEDAMDRASMKLTDVNAQSIIELRMGGGTKGAQTIFPGSTHKESGEVIEWSSNGEPARSDFITLKMAVTKIAIGVILVRSWPSKGSRHDAALALGGFFARAGWETSDIGFFVEVVAHDGGSDDPRARSKDAVDAAEAHARGENVYGLPKISELFGEAEAQKIAKFLDYRETVQPTNGLPIIQVKSGQLSTIATRGEEVLRDAGVQLFQRGGSLVRPIIETVEASHGRKTKVAQLVHIEAIYLRDMLSRVSKWQRYDSRKKEWIAINPPAEIASTILARVGEWSFPPIAGVISTPTMRPDGTILDHPGYDEATRLLLVEPPSMPPIPNEPTRDNALASLAMLEGLLVEFPFKDEVACAVALSALITPVVRGAFPVAPMHVARAPAASSGKSYLFDVVAAIAIGQPMPVMAAGRSEEETEKRLGAALLTGQPLISIDNVNGELAGDALCQIIERPIVEIRILGKSERVRIEARGTTLYCTGNNIVLVGDVCRRAITATLDSQLERPELREFKGDPVATVSADRGAFIAAALTICRAYIVADRPNRAARLASFEGWSDTVRSALIWLGKSDPLKSMEIARAEDPELGALREFLVAWADTIGIGYAHRCTMTDVIALINLRDREKLRWPELSASVNAVAGTRGPVDARGLGNWARYRKDRFVGDLRFVSKLDPKGSSEWWIEHKEGEKGEKPGAKDHF